MAAAPDTAEAFDPAVSEGQRRLGRSLLELISTAFIAGFTIVFGITALGIVETLVEPQFGELATLAGVLAVGLGVVFLVVGRPELCDGERFRPGRGGRRQRRLLATPCARPAVGPHDRLHFRRRGPLRPRLRRRRHRFPGTREVLTAFAEEAVHRTATTWFASAIAGGALVITLSSLRVAVNGVGARMALASMVGVLLALGPFDHVIVTVLHVLLGLLYGAPIGWGPLLAMGGVVAAGNLFRGLGLVTLTHVTQAMGARESGS